MGYSEIQSYCYRCGGPTLHASQWKDVPHSAFLLFALIFGLLTCGLGAVLVLFVWVAAVLFDALKGAPPYRCRQCGSVAGSAPQPQAMPLDAALASGRFDEIVGLEIEPRLGLQQPVFLYDYPANCGALARLKPDDQRWAERFELYIGGLELCNGFSELTDPAEQRMRFEREQRRRRRTGSWVTYPACS